MALPIELTREQALHLYEQMMRGHRHLKDPTLHKLMLEDLARICGKAAERRKSDRHTHRVPAHRKAA